MNYQQYKAWLDAANAAADMPEHHKAIKAELKDLAESGAVGRQQSNIAVTAICYADHCTTPLLARIAELEAMVGANPKSLFFSFCPANMEYKTHSTLEAAKKAAQESLDYYQGNACDGWDEEVFDIDYGIVLGGAYLADERPMDDEEKARFGVDSGEIWDVQLADFKNQKGGAA